MIHGIGVDLVRIDRIKSSLDRFGERFARRVLSEEEYPKFKETTNPSQFLAKRFAAKEALSKALGTGFRDGLSFRQITIVHDEFGKPSIRCRDHAQQMFIRSAISNCHLSISDEFEYALAYVTLETRDPD